MKKLILLIALCFVLCNAKTEAQFSGGDGTQATPYLISSKDDLEELADSVSNSPQNGTVYDPDPKNWSFGKYFLVTDNITDTIRIPIGLGFSTNINRAFQGVFNGNNKKITLGMNINQGSFNNNAGLFGSCLGATIINVIVDGYVLTAAEIQ